MGSLGSVCYIIFLGEKDSEFRKFSKGYFMNEARKKKIWGVVRMSSSASRGSMESVNFLGNPWNELISNDYYADGVDWAN